MKSNLFCRRFSTLLLTTALTIAAYGCGEPSATAESPTSQPSSPTAASAAVGADAAVAPAPTDAELESSDSRPAQTPEQNTVRPRIAEGYYAMGGTGQGLEVRGNQYRYYDEGGEYEWRPTSQLTTINPGHVFDGENYWCHSDSAPEGGGICTANGWQAYSSIGTIASDQFSLGGVEAGATEAEVIGQLGQPDQIDQVSPFSTRFTYRGMSMSFFEGAISNIRSVSPSYCTPSGLCPGATAAEAERLYGAPLVEPRSDADYWQYTNSEAACTMELEVTNETIGAIAILCQI
ncbi:hypothetical protein IQ254_06035 [Nodosilinea sp. LEGE 07088]|uniref:hypothetical protein n=1 Tax=Nodosilinea sp. LEGE 07088 TaxID=2777968 RepID=UPI001880091F|nr:hypothetical protein [Nodosilinea sp. LEGE 07088]MBE9136766.1 hypothetical protein [Nodosilinea sp. LEGE 07088]